MIYSKPKRKYYEPIVQNGLAVTPEEMADLTRRGIPISTSNIQGGFEETVDSGSDVPMEFRRGVDLNDVWNAREASRKKFKKLKFETPENAE